MGTKIQLLNKYNCEIYNLTQKVDINTIIKYNCKYCISDRGKYECLKSKGDTNPTVGRHKHCGTVDTES